MKLSVLGAGAWGTALAASWAPHHIVTLWGRNAAELDAMRTTRVNARYLADCRLPDALHFNPDLGSAVEAATSSSSPSPAAACARPWPLWPPVPVCRR